MKQLILPIKKIEPITFIGISLGFLAPALPLLMTVCIFILVDAILEVVKSFKQKNFCPTFLARLFTKVITYNAVLIAFFFFEDLVLKDFIIMVTSVPLFLTKILSIGLIWLELRSIEENFYNITGKRIVREFVKMINFGKEIKKEIQDESK
jgi:hypothetical protein